MSILKNSILNLIGYVIPSIVAIPALGYLARELGSELFGIYTIIIAIIGYTGFFDMGLTKAITRELSIYRNNIFERKKIISSATLFLLTVGILGSFVFFFFSDSIVYFLNIPISNFSDINSSFRLLSFSIPIFLLNQLWIAILEGDEKFKVITIQKSISSTFITGMPAIFIAFNNSLFTAIIGLIFSRIISLIITFLLVRSEVFQSGMKLDLIAIKRLFFFSSWITISNIINPIMVYLDRFIISNMLGVKYIAYYSYPLEIISRLGILPTALSKAIFPKFSSIKNKSEFQKNIVFSWLVMFIICIPVVFTGIFFSKKILNIWLGISYSTQLEDIIKILFIGFLFNAFAQIPFTTIQSVGKAKITALLHCIEIIPYFFTLYFLVKQLGLCGVAYAWSIRMTIDCIILTILSYFLIKTQQFC